MQRGATKQSLEGNPSSTTYLHGNNKLFQNKLPSSAPTLQASQGKTSPLLSCALHLQEQTKARKEMILKMLAGLLEGTDSGRDAASTDFEEPLDNKLEEERSALGRLAQLTQRDRKAPCKNFFWKTYTSC
uniref:Somatostatin/Cortistatin C-terminal domain-containing protein n=1 Tax=Sphenodon punctatus TaxID=8508 RepID=A0A8D0L5B3_SPHPU